MNSPEKLTRLHLNNGDEEVTIDNVNVAPAGPALFMYRPGRLMSMAVSDWAWQLEAGRPKPEPTLPIAPRPEPIDAPRFEPVDTSEPAYDRETVSCWDWKAAAFGSILAVAVIAAMLIARSQRVSILDHRIDVLQSQVSKSRTPQVAPNIER